MTRIWKSFAVIALAVMFVSAAPIFAEDPPKNTDKPRIYPITFHRGQGGVLRDDFTAVEKFESSDLQRLPEVPR